METSLFPVSVIIPALNEASYLRPTVTSLKEAFARAPMVPLEIIVVDNASTDGTAEVARGLGASVVLEPIRCVARARNAGANAAHGDILVFLDADTLVPGPFAETLLACAADPACLGGAFDADLESRRPVIRLHLAFWRRLGSAFGMAQGAAQFCRRDVFRALGGYDESLLMGEDVDFHWRLRRLARSQGGRVAFVRHVRVHPSARRFDQWPAWKTLLWTNPLVAALLRRSPGAWTGWYGNPPR